MTYEEKLADAGRKLDVDLKSIEDGLLHQGGWLAALADRVAALEGRPPEPPPEPEPSEPDPPDESPPAVITSGGAYHGHWREGVTILTTEPVTLRGRIEANGVLVNAPWEPSGQQLTLENLELVSLGDARAVVAERIASLAVRACRLQDGNGIYVNASSGALVVVDKCDARDIGRFRRTNARPLVQFFQLNNSLRVRGYLEWNEIVNTPGESRVEDVINIHASGGSQGQAFEIRRNLIRGAYPLNPLTDAFSGGGIIVGDGGGEHTHVHHNVVLDTLNYGVAIAGGRYQRLDDNLILGLNLVDGGRARGANIGAYVWNQSKHPDGHNTGARNRMAWHRHDGQRNDWWVPDAASWSDNEHVGVTPELIEAAHAAWREARPA